MGHLQIRHLDDAVIEQLIRRADALGIPVEQFLREVVIAAAQEQPEPVASAGARDAAE
ncbi:MAG: hypothetical protein HQL99_09255 [Magnetococcales bacterium]|nr:hypothetical protein [Magnetococcales bacterium]